MVFVQWGNEGESLRLAKIQAQRRGTMQHRLGAVELSGRAWGDSDSQEFMSYDICFRLHVIFTTEVKRYRIPEIRVSVWVRAFVTLVDHLVTRIHLTPCGLKSRYVS